MTMRRFTEHKPNGFPRMLDPWHVAVVDGRSLYRKRVEVPREQKGPLLTGHHNRKIGALVTKGAWAGMPIYTLTLEERATCPRTCRQWSTCYGNNMNWATRWRHGVILEALLERQLAELQRTHRRGFVVRLHVLGDFYSVLYVVLWERWLARYPALRVFGYTGWQPGSEIGDAVANVRNVHWNRFAVRTSNGPVGEPRAIILPRVMAGPVVDGAIICPAQTGRTGCCGSCGLCWGTKRDIAFLPH